MAISLHPRDFVMGGLIDDVDVEITDAMFIATDYDGTLPQATALALQLTMKILGDDSGQEHIQLYSAGSTADFVPDPEKDMKELAKNGTRESLTKTTNMALFLQSILDTGGDLGPMSDGNVGVLEGAQMHVLRKPAPKRDGLNQSARRQQDGREPTILLCSKVIHLPWWNKKGKAAATATKTTAKAAAPAAAKGKPAPAASEGMDDELLAAAVEWAQTDLMENGPSPLAQFRLRAFRNLKAFGLKAGPEANAFLSTLTSEAWLAENGMALNGDTVSIAA